MPEQDPTPSPAGLLVLSRTGFEQAANHLARAATDYRRQAKEARENAEEARGRDDGQAEAKHDKRAGRLDEMAAQTDDLCRLAQRMADTAALLQKADELTR